MLALSNASGNIGSSILSALLAQGTPPSEILTLTSRHPGSETWSSLTAQGVHVAHATYADPATFRTALSTAGATSLLLISSPRDAPDFALGPPGSGRESEHFAAIDAARAAGVQHIYYASLGFRAPFATEGGSAANLMRAHLRTEAYLATLTDVRTTVLRMGLYAESWPLYFGYWDVTGDARSEVVLPDAGTGRVGLTALEDIGVAAALVLSAPSDEWAGRRVHLSTTEGSLSLGDMARIVSEEVGRKVSVRYVSVDEYVEHYARERSDVDSRYTRFWSSTYEALKRGEGVVEDKTLTELLASKGRKVKRAEDRMREMLKEGRESGRAVEMKCTKPMGV